MSIRKSLEGLDYFPDGILIKATEIINMVIKVTKVHVRKGNNERYLNFFGIYHAYAECGILQNILLIGEKTGLKKGEITRALNKYSEIKTGIKMKPIRYTYHNYVDYCCGEEGLCIRDINTRELIKQKMDKFVEKNPDFIINRNILAFTVSFIKYLVAIMNGKSIKSSYLRERFLLCETVINTTYNKIGLLYSD